MTLRSRNRSRAAHVAICADDAVLAEALVGGLKDAGVGEPRVVSAKSGKEVVRSLSDLAKNSAVSSIVLALGRIEPLMAILAAIDQARAHAKPVLCFHPQKADDFRSDVLDAALRQRGALTCRYPEDVIELACAFQQLDSHKPTAIALRSTSKTATPLVEALSAEFDLSSQQRRGLHVFAIPEEIPLLGARARVAALVRATSHLSKLGKPCATPPTQDSVRSKALELIETLESTLTEREAKQLLGLYGIESPGEAVVSSASAAAAAAREIGFPVTLRVITPDVRSVAEIGGVATSIQNGAEARGAYARVLVAVHERVPQARLEGVLVAKAAPAGARLRVATRRHPMLGAAVTLGSADDPLPTGPGRAVRIAPLSIAESEEMLLESAALRLLMARQATGVDLPSLASLLHKTSLLAWDLRDSLEEVDLTVVVRPPREKYVVVEAGASKVE